MIPPIKLIADLGWQWCLAIFATCWLAAWITSAIVLLVHHYKVEKGTEKS